MGPGTFGLEDVHYPESLRFCNKNLKTSPKVHGVGSKIYPCSNLSALNAAVVPLTKYPEIIYIYTSSSIFSMLSRQVLQKQSLD